MASSSARAGDWITAAADGVRLRLKVTPRAGRTGVQGLASDAAGERHLAVRVAAQPNAGQANAELIRLPARRWRVPVRDLKIVSGATSRRKVLHVAGPPAQLVERLAAAEVARDDRDGGGP